MVVATLSWLQQPVPPRPVRATELARAGRGRGPSRGLLRFGGGLHTDSPQAARTPRLGWVGEVGGLPGCNGRYSSCSSSYPPSSSC